MVKLILKSMEYNIYKLVSFNFLLEIIVQWVSNECPRLFAIKI